MKGLGISAQGLGFSVQGLGFSVQGLGYTSTTQEALCSRVTLPQLAGKHYGDLARREVDRTLNPNP